MTVPGFSVEQRFSDDHAVIRFRGAWQAPAVAWRAEVMTLARYRRRHPAFAPEHGERTALMVLDDLDAIPRRVLVALPFESLSDGELLKVAIMLRNYRRLRPGLRQWSA